jgi:hypothetical protein
MATGSKSTTSRSSDPGIASAPIHSVADQGIADQGGYRLTGNGDAKPPRMPGQDA